MLFASLATGISIGLVMVPVFLKGIVPEDSIFAQPLYAALVVALATVTMTITGIVSVIDEFNDADFEGFQTTESGLRYKVPRSLAPNAEQTPSGPPHALPIPP